MLHLKKKAAEGSLHKNMAERDYEPANMLPLINLDPSNPNQ